MMNYIVTKPIKSRGIAIIAVIFLGGLGLFYSTIAGGIIMGIIAPVLIVTFLIKIHFWRNLQIIGRNDYGNHRFHIVLYAWIIPETGPKFL